MHCAAGLCIAPIFEGNFLIRAYRFSTEPAQPGTDRKGPTPRCAPVRATIRRPESCRQARIRAAHSRAVLRAAGRRPHAPGAAPQQRRHARRSEEHTSELQSLMRISYAVFCLKKKTTTDNKEKAHK